MSWTPTPNMEEGYSTFITVAIPLNLITRLEKACDAISQATPKGYELQPEDIIVIIGLQGAESLIYADQLSQLFAHKGEHDDRP